MTRGLFLWTAWWNRGKHLVLSRNGAYAPPNGDMENYDDVILNFEYIQNEMNMEN